MTTKHIISAQTNRRLFITLGTAGAVTLLLKNSLFSQRVQAAAAPLADRLEIEDFSATGKSQGLTVVPSVRKTQTQWQQQLSPIAYDVTREEGTERPYTGPNWDQHAVGLYRCVCCDTALFSSAAKFDSGTGWPSFYQVLAKHNVHELSDSSIGMERTAVSCARCNAHLGHVFDDGPRPTGLRYCMNGFAMRFQQAS